MFGRYNIKGICQNINAEILGYKEYEWLIPRFKEMKAKENRIRLSLLDLKNVQSRKDSIRVELIGQIKELNNKLLNPYMDKE